jgi:hypothetical protein
MTFTVAPGWLDLPGSYSSFTPQVTCWASVPDVLPVKLLSPE